MWYLVGIGRLALSGGWDVAITCWYADARQLEDKECFARGMDKLRWDERREQIGRFRFDKDRRLCLAGGLIIAHALRTWGVHDLTLSVGEYGKPFLAHVPDVHFNLSHAGVICTCAVSDDPVGVDVETCREVIDGVARRCFQECELTWLYAQPDVDEAFTRLWTRKESYLKLLGTGFAREANSFAAAPGHDGKLDASFFECEVEAHALCVCSATCCDVTLERFDLSLI